MVVLDRDLPGVHGDEVCRQIVAGGSGSRVLMLTAASTVGDRVDGLGLGADDYLPKPFDFAELVARIRALARRPPAAVPPVLDGRRPTLDPARRVAFRAGRRLDLSPKEFAVLECLLAAGGRVVSAEELLERVWDEAADPFTTAVKTTIRRLRAKLGDPPVIHTVREGGYRIGDADERPAPVRAAVRAARSSSPALLFARRSCSSAVSSSRSTSARPGIAGGQAPVRRHPFGPVANVVASLVVLVLLSVAVGWLLAGRLLRPLRMITATARDISASNLSRRLRTGRRDDEFTRLGETLNDLFARLEAAFDSQRHFVANASHELRTPLTAERTLLQVALADPDADAATLRAACEQVLALGHEDRAAHRRAAHPGQQRARHRAAGAVRPRRPRRHRPRGPRRGGQPALRAARRQAGPSARHGRPWAGREPGRNLVDNALRYNVPGGRAEVSTATRAARRSSRCATPGR